MNPVKPWRVQELLSMAHEMLTRTPTWGPESPYALIEMLSAALRSEALALDAERALAEGGAAFRLCMFCQSCGKLHVDIGEWATRPHKTHLCVDDDSGPGCGARWKPSEYPTVGVATLQDTMYLPGDELPKRVHR